MVTMETMIKSGTDKMRKIDTETEEITKTKKINTMRRTNIGTNKTKKIGISAPGLIEFNTVTKRIDTGTNKTSCTMTWTTKTIKKMMMTTISIQIVREDKSAMSMMNSVEKEVTSSNAEASGGR